MTRNAKTSITTRRAASLWYNPQQSRMGRPYKEVLIRKEWCSPFVGCTISFLCRKPVWLGHARHGDHAVHCSDGDGCASHLQRRLLHFHLHHRGDRGCNRLRQHAAGSEAESDPTQRTIHIANLHPFEGHPYQVRDDAEMDALVESMDQTGTAGFCFWTRTADRKQPCICRTTFAAWKQSM